MLRHHYGPRSAHFEPQGSRDQNGNGRNSVQLSWVFSTAEKIVSCLSSSLKTDHVNRLVFLKKKSLQVTLPALTYLAKIILKFISVVSQPSNLLGVINKNVGMIWNVVALHKYKVFFF